MRCCGGQGGARRLAGFSGRRDSGRVRKAGEGAVESVEEDVAGRVIGAEEEVAAVSSKLELRPFVWLASGVPASGTGGNGGGDVRVGVEGVLIKGGKRGLVEIADVVKENAGEAGRGNGDDSGTWVICDERRSGNIEAALGIWGRKFPQANCVVQRGRREGIRARAES